MLLILRETTDGAVVTGSEGLRIGVDILKRTAVCRISGQGNPGDEIAGGLEDVGKIWFTSDGNLDLSIVECGRNPGSGGTDDRHVELRRIIHGIQVGFICCHSGGIEHSSSDGRYFGNSDPGIATQRDGAEIRSEQTCCGSSDRALRGRSGDEDGPQRQRMGYENT